MSRGLRFAGADLTVVDEPAGPVVLENTHGLTFVGPGIVAALDPLRPGFVEVTVAAGAGATLQDVYDNGSLVVTNAEGDVEVQRGATHPAGEALLSLVDPLGVVADPHAELIQSADVATGPMLLLSLRRATPAIGDIHGRIRFQGRNSLGADVTFAQLDEVAEAVAAGGEFGRLDLRIITGGGAGRAAFFRGVGAAAEKGLRIGSAVVAGTTPAVELQAVANFGVDQSVVLITESGGATALCQIDGIGSVIALGTYRSRGVQAVGTPLVNHNLDRDTGLGFPAADQVALVAGASDVLTAIAAGGRVVITGDVEAAGGYRDSLGPWMENAPTLGQMDNPLEVGAVGSLREDWIVARSGSVTGIAYVADLAVVLGETLTVNVRVNGVIVFTMAVVNADGTSRTTTQAKDVDAFVAGDLVSVSYSTTGVAGDAGPTEITVYVEIEE